MGGLNSKAPKTVNSCTDPGDPSVTDKDIPDFCSSAFNSTTTATEFCSRYGGTGETFDSGRYPNPEFRFTGDDGGCCFDTCKPGNSGDCGGCSSGCCGVAGNKGQCSKTRNTGDPLLCCLRDFQCNSTNQNTCFSNDNMASTCNKDFRAADTPYCNSLLTQFCLGNLDASSGIDLSQSDFTSLWTNALDPTPKTDDPTNPYWTVKKLPQGTKYITSEIKTSTDIEFLGNFQDDVTQSNDIEACKINPLNGEFVNNGSKICQTTTWAPGSVPNGPRGALPTNTEFKFNFNNLPPCQSIFWRTLYGNGPTFKNGQWKAFGGQNVCPDGSDICEQTSTTPAVAACSALPFKGSITPIGKIQAQKMLEAAVDKYNFINKGSNITDSFENLRDAPFVQWLYSVCSAYPDLCSNILNKSCGTKTLDEMQFNPALAQWCGCYMDSKQYKKYTDTYGISRECTPTCNTNYAIPYYDLNTGKKKFCEQSVCIIDDVTINLAKTVVNGGINFNQICNSCSASSGTGININSNNNTNYTNLTGASSAANAVVNESTGANTNSQADTSSVAITNCQCIMNNINLTTVGATIDGGINISQSCNGNAKCYATVLLDGANETTQEVDCHSGNVNTNDVVAQAEAALIKKAQDTSNAWVVLIFILVIGLIVIAWLVINPGKIPDADTTVSKKYNYVPPGLNYNDVNNFISLREQSKPKKALFY